jgi:hypothetical protein
MLPFPMFFSLNPPISCRSLFEHSFSFTSSPSFTSSTSISPLAQTLPTFSTPSKQQAHSNSCNSIPLMRLLHTSLDTPGVGCQPLTNHPFPHPSSFRSHVPTAAPPTPFPATLAASLQPTEIPATLSPFAATLTGRINHNPFVCHSYKKHPGVGSHRLPATGRMPKGHVSLPAARKVGYNLHALTADLCRRARILRGRLS